MTTQRDKLVKKLPQVTQAERMELGWAAAYAGLAAVLRGTTKEGEGQVWG